MVSMAIITDCPTYQPFKVFLKKFYNYEWDSNVSNRETFVEIKGKVEVEATEIS